MLAREIMTVSPSCVTPDDPLSAGAELMRDLDVGLIPVVENRDARRLSPSLQPEANSMKTDTQIQKDVIDELRWDPSIRENEIGVASKDGVVTLSGVVDSYAEKYAAERAAQRVSGVRAVAEDLAVQLLPTLKRTDADIAHAAVTALKWDIQVPDEKIKAKVDEGYITLSGDVEWKFQQDAAERAVRYLTGVKGVANLINVMPKRVSKVEVGAKIKDALRRNAERDADRITVEAVDGKVTLKGTVRSFAERSDAERAAWSAPGVSSVDDRIAIG